MWQLLLLVGVTGRGLYPQAFLPWASLTTRLWAGAAHMEVEWTAGPIPFKDGLGRELSVGPTLQGGPSTCRGSSKPMNL